MREFCGVFAIGAGAGAEALRLRAVWISSAPTTIAMPTASFTVGSLPSAALISSADTGTKLKASVGSGFKAPTLSELFQDFPPYFFAPDLAQPIQIQFLN